jgi:peptide-methionine (R)-S-oxide reductase
MDKSTYPVTRTEAEWRARLTPEQYAVMRNHGTERPNSCALLLEKRPGVFECAGCDTPLFESKLKFESGTGWPSFTVPIEGSVAESRDASHGMIRTGCTALRAAAISATSSPTARRRPACATASTAWR